MFLAFTAKGQNESLSMGQPSKTIAILSMDCQGVDIDNVQMGNLVRLELEKTGVYQVMDKYDVAFQIKEAGIEQKTCFGKNQLVEAGKVLKTDLMLTGSVEEFGDKIIFTLRLIDVNQGTIPKAVVKEYVNQISDLQVMTRLTIAELLGLPFDQTDMEMLASFDKPITNDRSSISLNGPRFGLQQATGRLGSRLMDAKSNGGLGLNNPFFSTFGYQWETQYISAGEFQALFEFIPTINAIETGTPSLSFSVIHGMRYHGWELGFGPTFRLTKLADGYFDNDGNWFLDDGSELPADADIVQAFDTRGAVKLNTGLVVAVGKTIHSGYLNIPINIFWSPSPQLKSNTVGLILGFNIAKTPIRRDPN